MEKLFWIDMEMTGLDVEKEVVIEVAAIVTDIEFRVLDTFETVVRQPQVYLENMDDWNKKQHGRTGLTQKVPNGMDPDHVEESLLDLIKKHWPEGSERPMLAGNSIAQDRLFIMKYFKRLEKALHYRMLDVSSFKIIMQKKFNYKYEKSGSHRALDDIRESIEELRRYCEFINPPNMKK